MRDGLSPIYQNLTSIFVGLAHQFSNGINCSENVGNVRYSEELDCSFF